MEAVMTSNIGLFAGGRLRRRRFFAWMCMYASIFLCMFVAAQVSWGTWQFWTHREGMGLLTQTGIVLSLCLLLTSKFSSMPRVRLYRIWIFNIATAMLLLTLFLFLKREYYSRPFLLITWAGVSLLPPMVHALVTKTLYPARAALCGMELPDNLRAIRNLVWIALPESPSDPRPDIIILDEHVAISAEDTRCITKLSSEGVPVMGIDQVYEDLMGRIDIIGRPQGQLWRVLQPKTYPLLKSFLDYCLVFLSLPIVVPAMVVIALGVWLDTGGPIFYRQIRVGKGSRPFTMFKFRSMQPNSDIDTSGQPSFTSENDPRITRFGRWIRRSRIDELPQIFNVLRGDMSLIGPRPEQVPFAEEFERTIPSYAFRHTIAPGITGWAQVHSEYASDADSTRVKLELDLYYVKNQSLWLDAIIILKTIRTVLSAFGAR